MTRTTRMVVATLIALMIAVSGSVQAEPRPSLTRPDVFDVGEPMSIDRAGLHRQMLRITELAEFIKKYGWPDYAEIQEVSVKEPFAPYEVRIYYLSREQELAFGHVYVAPDVTHYGIKKYVGRIPAETLTRLLK